jgi:hypothetical protein
MRDPSAIDYEVEYNNRARVPEWPEHFARLGREAAAYREHAAANGRVELGLPYGPSARQTIDLFFAESRERAPLAVFIHGGWFRSLEPTSFSQLAGGLNPHGGTIGTRRTRVFGETSVALRRGHGHVSAKSFMPSAVPPSVQSLCTMACPHPYRRLADTPPA